MTYLLETGVMFVNRHRFFPRLQAESTAGGLPSRGRRVPKVVLLGFDAKGSALVVLFGDLVILVPCLIFTIT